MITSLVWWGWDDKFGLARKARGWFGTVSGGFGEYPSC